MATLFALLPPLVGLGLFLGTLRSARPRRL